MLPEPKDVILAVLGASVSIAGLLLVFCGFLFSQAAIFPSVTADATIQKFRRGGRFGVIPLLSALIVAGTSFAWLLSPNVCLYRAATIGFFVALAATAAYGVVTILYFL